MVVTHSALRNVSLAEAARLVGGKEVSPVELVDCCLERIAAVNDRLKAYITVYDEQARQVARAAEAMIMAGIAKCWPTGCPTRMRRWRCG